MKLIKLKGIYESPGKFNFDSTIKIEWKELTKENPPELPFGSTIELTISFDENEFLTGKDGIVWATFDLRQAEIIQSSLLAQHISSEKKGIESLKGKVFLIKIMNESDVEEAINFIWKTSSGLRLKPDWNYPNGEVNKSFEQWLSGQ